MQINGVAHTFITAGNFAAAREFYGKLLPFLGMTIVADTHNTFYGVGGRTGFGIHAPTPEAAGQRFRQGTVGLHHHCWRARERRTQRAQRTSSIDEGSDGVVRGSIAPDAVSTAAELRLIVMSLLGVLPTAQAEALLLRFVLGHSLQEIAEISGAPLNTVRSRIRLAREALQRRLAHDDRLRALVEEDDHV